MIVDTEGIILRQFKTVNGRTMLVMFSRKLGKISVATNLTGGGKNRSALAAKPFAYGNYELYKGRELYDLNSGRVIESFYGIGDDLDRFGSASYCLELTDRILMEEDPQPRLFNELTEYLKAIEQSKGNSRTLTMAYIVKALNHTGTMPELDNCAICGKDMTGFRPAAFSVKDGGIICGNCLDDTDKTDEGTLIYTVNFDIINILKYFKNEPFSRFEKIRLDDRLSEELMKILRSYMAYHLDVKDLKSEFMTF